jgi:hypothetical protein
VRNGLCNEFAVRMLGSAEGDYKIRVVRAKSLSNESDFEMFTMNVYMYVGNNSEKKELKKSL